jgi:hypothetical protein
VWAGTEHTGELPGGVVREPLASHSQANSGDR